MRKLTSHEIKNLETLTKYSIESTLIEPTATGLGKSILDATGQVRNYLKTQGVHDYELQGQGGHNKIYVDSLLLSKSQIIKAKASLYRPPTKKGDPRIWITKLPSFVNANDIIAIIYFDNALNILNISQINIQDMLDSGSSNPIKELILAISGQSNRIAQELLALLRIISNRGPIPALLNADTAVGRTLESLLGIDINSSCLPDFKGIELKSFRSARNNRKSLFAQVPDWSISKFKSSDEILNNFGYISEGRLQLNCTVSARSRNPQSLTLRVEEKLELLFENSDIGSIGDFVVWKLEKLHQRLLEKHNETFWISADSTWIDGIEHFHYTLAEHTRKPIASQFDLLLSQGLITLDHMIKRDSGKNRAAERGPFFKIRKSAATLLFPPSQIYNLTDY
jgi:hypothetical protein